MEKKKKMKHWRHQSIMGEENECAKERDRGTERQTDRQIKQVGKDGRRWMKT